MPTPAGRLGLGAVSLALLVAFVARQATAAAPLMPLRILRSRNVAGANLAQMLALSGMFAFQVLVALGHVGRRTERRGPRLRPFNTTQQVGMAIGVAVLSTVAASRTGELITAGRPAAEALTEGYRLAFGISAGLLVAAFLVALFVLRQPAAAEEPTAAETAPA